MINWPVVPHMNHLNNYTKTEKHVETMTSSKVATALPACSLTLVRVGFVRGPCGAGAVHAGPLHTQLL